MAEERWMHDEEASEVVETTRRLWSVEGRNDVRTPLEFDRVIHERVRLGIVSALAVNGTLSFGDLKAIFDLTDGNLSAHARKLEDAGYVLCAKIGERRGARTEYRLTEKGHRELEGYLEHMEALIRSMRPAAGTGGQS